MVNYTEEERAYAKRHNLPLEEVRRRLLESMYAEELARFVLEQKLNPGAVVYH